MIRFTTKAIFLIALYVTCALPTLQAQSPKFFGLTSQGGKGGTGAIIEYDIESKSLRDPAPTGFTNFASGSQSLWNQLTEYNGKLYGTTRSGGTFFGGVLFEYDPATNSYLKIHDFEQTSFPSGHLTVVDGKLYGTTTSGINNAGVIFEYDPATNIFSEKYVYNVANRDEAGSTPAGGLVYVEGELYGMTSSGGRNNVGVIFSYNIATGAYTKIRDFDFTRDGGIPYGNLTLYNGDLYGSTTAGGSTGNGTLFRLNGSSFSFSEGRFDVLYYFLEGRDASDSQYPDDGSLTVFNDKLYGMRPKGGFSNIGDNDLGFVFEFDPTDNGITKYDFDGRIGSTPYGSLTVLNDKLYGMTLLGGSFRSGFIFEFLPEETFKFDGYSFDGTNGASPFGSLTAYNGKLYGITSAGGINDEGVLFEYEPERKIYSKKLDFNFNNGSNPSGSLIKYNGKLFGTADAGGSNNLGVLYEYDPSTESYTKNIDFVGDNGSKPNGRLTAYNGKLYGVTSVGGRFIDHGLIYEYDPESKEYSKGHEFNGLNGSTPIGGLTEYNGILYGVTARGGAGDKGVLFGYDPIRRGLVLIFEFDGTNGISPRGPLTVHDGKLYGTALGGTTEGGILFAYDPSNGEFTEKYNFEDGKGLGPNGSMIVYNGKLYGLTNLTSFSNNDGGVLFEYDPVTNIYSRKYSFVGNDGSNPRGGLTEYNGKLYGMTARGDNFYAYGTVFEYDPVNEAFAKNADFNMSNGAFPFGSLTLFTIPPVELGLSATKVDEFCPGRNGSIDLTITGATGTPGISWTGPDLFTADVEDLNNLSAGIYKVVVTDDAGATGNLEVEILLTPDTEAPTAISLGEVVDVEVNVAAIPNAS
ncbi:choice-of-anchor tandem repeat GloVer-containing protein, partial [Algoriphagus sp. SE2]|uniref:choice-of-anchor tandem repeat GloVer-containing protein n=1 Tax=Algoriphagus sp. SE2 TaxID=3141536 RepID=UPI0031CCF1F3